VATLRCRGGDRWSARRRQFGRRCHAGEQRRGIRGRERADGWVSAVSGGGARVGLGGLRMREWLGVGAKLGRHGENGP
jgi:hypothetical protein